MSEKYECGRCNKQFTSTSNINKHYKNARYCKNINNEEITCQKCNNIFINNHILIDHMSICQGNIPELKQKILKLEEQLDILQTKYNINLKLENSITNDRIKTYISKLTITDFKDGPIGLSNWAYTHFLRDSVVCTDVSRKKIIWKNVDNKIIKDYKGYKLCKKIFKVLHKDNYSTIHNEIKNLEDSKEIFNNNKHIIWQLNMIKSECINIVEGIQNEYCNKFINYLLFMLNDDIESSDTESSDTESSNKD